MKIGGYQILDFKGETNSLGEKIYNDFGNLTYTIRKNGTYKPILISGLHIGEEIVNDCFVSLTERIEQVGDIITYIYDAYIGDYQISIYPDYTIITQETRDFVILDFGGEEIEPAGEGVTIEGIYDKIEGTNKAILIRGFNDGTTDYHDTFVDFTVSSTDFVGTLYSYTITVTDADLVTITT